MDFLIHTSISLEIAEKWILRVWSNSIRITYLNQGEFIDMGLLRRHAGFKVIVHAVKWVSITYLNSWLKYGSKYGLL